MIVSVGVAVGVVRVGVGDVGRAGSERVGDGDGVGLLVRVAVGDGVRVGTWVVARGVDRSVRDGDGSGGATTADGAVCDGDAAPGTGRSPGAQPISSPTVTPTTAAGAPNTATAAQRGVVRRAR